MGAVYRQTQKPIMPVIRPAKCWLEGSLDCIVPLRPAEAYPTENSFNSYQKLEQMKFLS